MNETRENEVRLMLDRIDHNTKHHPPDEDQVQVHTAIREAAKAYMYVIASRCPASRETSLALTAAEESMMWANAAVARNTGG
mgnify:CR=1 FL=1